jgi:hypothetical protein
MSLEDKSYEERDELARLALQLSNDPKTRPDFMRLTRQVRPDVAMPELEIEERVNTAFNSAQQKIASLEAKLAERDAVDNLESRRKSLLEKGLVQSRSEVQEVEKLMLEKGITNHEAAAEHYKYMQQAAVPTPSGYNPNPMRQFDLSAFRKNPIQAARDVAAQAMSEIRKPTRPIGL